MTNKFIQKLRNSREIIENEGSASELKKTAETAKTQLSGFADGFFQQLLGFSGISSAKTETAHAPDLDAPANQEQHSIDIFNFALLQKTDTQPKKLHAEKKHRHEQAAKSERRAAIEYHEEFQREVIDSRHKFTQKEAAHMQQRIQDIMAELQKLVKSSKMLEVQFREVSVEQTPVQSGEYHMNFFEWMLIVIKQAREKVEDSGAWLNTVKGKRGKKQTGYWEMFKKHGTTFGMSNERAVATQTG